MIGSPSPAATPTLTWPQRRRGMQSNYGPTILGFSNMLGGGSCFVDLPRDARRFSLTDHFAKPTQLLVRKKSLAALRAESLDVSCGIMSAIDEAASRTVAIDGADAIDDPVCGHRLGLADPPMHLGATAVIRSSFRLAMKGDGMLQKVDAIVHDG